MVCIGSDADNGITTADATDATDPGRTELDSDISSSSPQLESSAFSQFCWRDIRVINFIHSVSSSDICMYAYLISSIFIFQFCLNYKNEILYVYESILVVALDFLTLMSRFFTGVEITAASVWV
jgi:hypothetical protein